MSKKQDQTESKARGFKGVEGEVGDRIEDNINKIRFLADCFASGTALEITDDGYDGCYQILNDIANDLQDAISEPVKA